MNIIICAVIIVIQYYTIRGVTEVLFITKPVVDTKANAQ